MSVCGRRRGWRGRAAGRIASWGARRCLVPCGFCGSLGAFGACLMLSLWLVFCFLGFVGMVEKESTGLTVVEIALG